MLLLSWSVNHCIEAAVVFLLKIWKVRLVWGFQEATIGTDKSRVYVECRQATWYCSSYEISITSTATVHRRVLWLHIIIIIILLLRISTADRHSSTFLFLNLK